MAHILPLITAYRRQLAPSWQTIHLSVKGKPMIRIVSTLTLSFVMILASCGDGRTSSGVSLTSKHIECPKQFSPIATNAVCGKFTCGTGGPGPNWVLSRDKNEDGWLCVKIQNLDKNQWNLADNKT